MIVSICREPVQDIVGHVGPIRNRLVPECRLSSLGKFAGAFAEDYCCRGKYEASCYTTTNTKWLREFHNVDYAANVCSRKVEVS
jgi:hypothetical protein